MKLPLSPTIRQRQREEGSALMLVMALIMMLTYLVFTTMRVVRSDIEFADAGKKGFRCRCLAEMGINIAMNPVVKRTDANLLNQIFTDDGYEQFTVKIRGEGGKLNINTLVNPSNPDKELLKRLFEAWGLTDDHEVDSLIENMIDWVDKDDEHLEHGMEKEQYEKLGIVGSPFNHYFYSLDDLELVHGFDAISARKKDWKKYLTIYSQGKLDLNEASAELIEIVCDTTAEDALQFVESRYGDDKQPDTKDDHKYGSVQEAMGLLNIGSGPHANDPEFTDRTSQRLTVNDSTTSIQAIGQVGDVRRQINVVVRNRQQPQILGREETQE